MAAAAPDDTEETGPRFTTSLIGHEATERLFLEGYVSKRLHHAWLLTGPKGVGKATLAWRIAKFMLAQPEAAEASLFGDPLDPTSLDVDPQQDAVRRILSGAHGDLTELIKRPDPKTGKMRKDITIDQVRSLTERFQQTTSEGGWRIALIDSVDDMNRSAANGLLKLLEEPPAKSLFLLVSHAPGRLLPTIRSRCRTLTLTPLPVGRVKSVLVSQEPSLSSDDLSLAAALSEGAPGRGLDLVAGGGLALYRETIDTLGALVSGRTARAHSFADKISSVKADAEFRLVCAFFMNFLSRCIRASSGVALDSQDIDQYQDPADALIAQLSTVSPLAPWLELWDKVSHRMERLDAINLDRRQFVVGFLSDFSGIASR